VNFPPKSICEVSLFLLSFRGPTLDNLVPIPSFNELSNSNIAKIQMVTSYMRPISTLAWRIDASSIVNAIPKNEEDQ
jgi:hypothetical protein